MRNRSRIIAYLPNVARVSSHSVRFMARDMVELSRFLEFVTSYEPGLQP
ncbi:MAG: hypothetical protein H0U66_02430 [Gemmatimonadaceae bacterium]|nr:hypothetical protein [Gemmatimonadaceae bacterium]